ncbi:hypothetical protein QOT17_002922 [Balamuthia mandrillaris]
MRRCIGWELLLALSLSAAVDVGRGAQLFSFLGVENPIPGTTTQARFKLHIQGVYYGTCRFYIESSSLVQGNAGIIKSDPSSEWDCFNKQCFTDDVWAICYMATPDEPYCRFNEVIFKVDIAIPFGAIRKKINDGKGVWNNRRFSMNAPASRSSLPRSTDVTHFAFPTAYPEWKWAAVTAFNEAALSFTTGEAVVSLNSSIHSQPFLHIAGKPSVMEVWVGNFGPSNARDSVCDIKTSHPEFVVLTPNCQMLEDANRLRCNGTGDIIPMTEGSITEVVILPSPDYRGMITIEADNCFVFGSVNSMLSQVHNFNVTSLWNLTQSFADATGGSLYIHSVANITSLIHNEGPSSSLRSICTWDFSVAALRFEGSVAQASNCEASYHPHLRVSCQVDAAPGNTTPSISVSALSDLAGTPTFDVSFACLDEAGLVVGGEQPSLNVMFIEELGDVDVRVDIGAWPSDKEAETEREHKGITDGRDANSPKKKRKQVRSPVMLAWFARQYSPQFSG